LAALRGYELEKFIEVATAKPHKFITTEDATAGKINPKISFMDEARSAITFLAIIVNVRGYANQNGRL